jgi:o-succinylbenzoate---CoA ligase
MNDRCYLEAMLAITAAGCVCCPFNPRWSSAESEQAISACKPSLALLGAAFSLPPSPASGIPLRHVPLSTTTASEQSEGVPARTKAAAITPAAATPTLDTTEELIRSHYGSPLDLQVAPHGTAFICFTSGASAAPKAVEISHLSLHVQSLAKLAAVGYRIDDVFLHSAPLHHIGVPCCLPMLCHL